MIKLRFFVIGVCLLILVAMFPSSTIPAVVPFYTSPGSEVAYYNFAEKTAPPTPTPEPSPASAPALLWMPERSDMYISDEDFCSWADSAIIGGISTLPDRDICYLASAFSLGAKYHDFSEHISKIAAEIAYREHEMPTVDNDWLYLCDAALVIFTQAAASGIDPLAYELSLAYWTEGLVAAYVDGRFIDDYKAYAHIAALMQTVVFLADADANDIFNIDPRELLLCRAGADRTAQTVLENANLGIGLPLWFAHDNMLRLSEQAQLGLFLERYKANGGTIDFPYTNIQLEATFDAFHIEDARALHPGEFFEYSYWIYRTEGPQCNDKPETQTIAEVAAANRISGRNRLTRFAILEIIERGEMHSAAAIYAFAHHLYN